MKRNHGYVKEPPQPHQHVVQRHYSPTTIPRRARVPAFPVESDEGLRMVVDLMEVVELQGGRIMNMGRTVTMLRARGWVKL